MTVVEALARECEALCAALRTLAEADFSRPTRCPDWTVREMVGHLCSVLRRVGTALGETAPASAETDAAGYYARIPGRGDEGRTERARSEAAGLPTGAELVKALDTLWRHAFALASREEGTRIVRTIGPAMRLDEFIVTRVVEVTVHGLDLARAEDRDPWITKDAAALVEAVLWQLLGGTPPDALGWDDVAFIEKATGRLPLTDVERGALGDRGARFPLLS